MYKNGREVGTFDSGKFNVDVNNFVEFVYGFVDKDSGRDLLPNQKSFGKCLGRKKQLFFN